MRNVCIIDDDPSVRKALQRLVRSAGMEAEAFASAEEFIHADCTEAQCLVLDVRMPGMSGLELQQYLSVEQRHLPIIFISAHDDERCRREALSAGACAFLHKPFDDQILVDAISRAIAKGATLSDKRGIVPD